MNTSGMFSTSKGNHDSCGGYHEYIDGCSAHRSFHIFKSKCFRV